MCDHNENDQNGHQQVESVELVRGKQPDNIKEICLKLCQDYLAANWCQQTMHTIEVRRLSGGLTNQLYYCAVGQPDPTSAAPQAVAVRLHEPKMFNWSEDESHERLQEMVCEVLLSDCGIGPHIYGVFGGGTLQMYYRHRQFLKIEHGNPEIVDNVFRTLARIHAMSPPLPRQTGLFTCMQRAYKEAYEVLAINEDIERYDCRTLKNNDLRAEMEWSWSAVKAVNSPLVFTHNDYRSSNLMITEPDNRLMVCDFEYSGFNFRGHDFRELMREWAQDVVEWSTTDLPPDDAVFGPLIQIYVDECHRIHGKEWTRNAVNCVEHILKESKVFLMNSFLIYTLLFMKNERDKHQMPFDRRLSMELADKSFANYFSVKKKLIEQNIVRIS